MLIFVLIMILNGIFKKHATHKTSSKTECGSSHGSQAMLFLWLLLLVVLLRLLLAVVALTSVLLLRVTAAAVSLRR